MAFSAYRNFIVVTRIYLATLCNVFFSPTGGYVYMFTVNPLDFDSSEHSIEIVGRTQNTALFRDIIKFNGQGKCIVYSISGGFI